MHRKETPVRGIGLVVILSLVALALLVTLFR